MPELNTNPKKPSKKPPTEGVLMLSGGRWEWESQTHKRWMPALGRMVEGIRFEANAPVILPLAQAERIAQNRSSGKAQRVPRPSPSGPAWPPTMRRLPSS